MATYVEYARSNYFHVKDRDAFDEFCKWNDIRLAEHEGRVAMIFNESVPTIDFSADEGAEEPKEDVDFYDGLMPHIADGEICVIQAAGVEGNIRYAGGWSVALDNTGDSVWLNLDEIYQIARDKWGDTVTITQAYG